MAHTRGPRRGGNGPRSMREHNQRLDAIAAAARDRAERGDVVRGTVAYVRCDINTLSERGARPDGTDRHLVKGRPVIVWSVDLTGEQPRVSVVPMSRNADTGLRMHDPVLRRDGSRLQGEAMNRLVNLHLDDIDALAVVADLTARDLAMLSKAVEDGQIIDLTASTGDRPANPKRVAGRKVWQDADAAFAELHRRRQAHLAEASTRIKAKANR